jgi:hypothetical protein
MTKMRKLSVLGVVGFALMGDASLGWCDSIVVSSENQRYAIGQSLKDDVLVEVAPQETLRVMDSDSGETRVISGPYKGKISAYTPACAGVLACDPGKKQSSIGATRALTNLKP